MAVEATKSPIKWALTTFIQSISVTLKTLCLAVLPDD